MANDEEKEEEEYTVVKPDPLAAAESDPGKVINNESGITTIKNVDLLNAVYLAYLDSIKKRARESIEEVQAEIRQYAQSENEQIYSARSVSVQMIEMHTQTLTYFEGVAFQFLQWAMEVEHELESHIRDRADFEFPTEDPPREWDEDTQKKFHQKISALDYIKGLSNAGFLENEAPLHDIKKRRNDYIHNPTKALGLRTSTDSYPGSALFDDDDRPEQLQEENLNEVASDVLLDCMAALDEIEKMVEKHLPVNQAIYESIYEQ